MMTRNTVKITTLSVVSAIALSACGAGDRLANVGKPPELTQITNPQTTPDYRPISMPMPAPEIAYQQPNSLWQSNRKSFFKDQRASNIGDILTVVIDFKEEAGMENKTSRSRSASENAALNSLLGFETRLDRIPFIPDEINPASLADFGTGSNHSGNGKTEREEEITLKMAAIITQILPNGNLVIRGNQEVRVNFEKRVLQMQGIIRPEDITVDNSISYEKIAEARISYGGEGQLMDMQQPRYGQQVLDVLMPF